MTDRLLLSAPLNPWAAITCFSVSTKNNPQPAQKINYQTCNKMKMTDCFLSRFLFGNGGTRANSQRTVCSSQPILGWLHHGPMQHCWGYRSSLFPELSSQEAFCGAGVAAAPGPAALSPPPVPSPRDARVPPAPSGPGPATHLFGRSSPTKFSATFSSC